MTSTSNSLQNVDGLCARATTTTALAIFCIDATQQRYLVEAARTALAGYSGDLSRSAFRSVNFFRKAPGAPPIASRFLGSRSSSPLIDAYWSARGSYRTPRVPSTACGLPFDFQLLRALTWPFQSNVNQAADALGRQGLEVPVTAVLLCAIDKASAGDTIGRLIV
jgi:hypothetical protein